MTSRAGGAASRGAAGLLLARDRCRVLEHGKNRLKPSYLQDLPHESQNSTADMSTTSLAGSPLASAAASSLCSLGAVYKSISPASATMARSP